MKRFLVCTLCLLTTLAATSLAAMDYFVAPLMKASDHLAPIPLLVVGLLRPSH